VPNILPFAESVVLQAAGIFYGPGSLARRNKFGCKLFLSMV
jgi:hypothetical protein